MIERRSAPLSSEVTGRRATGYASIFGAPSRMFRDVKGRPYRERIAPGAFARSLERGNDVVLLFNHQRSALLGRTASGTVRLWTDAMGLGFWADLPETTLGRDLAVLMRRGDLREMSFAGTIRADEWRKGEDGTPERIVTEWDLDDVSLVTRAAYPATFADLRADLDALAERDIRSRRLSLTMKGLALCSMTT